MRRALALLLLTLLAACGSSSPSTPPEPDGGTPDGGTPDGGSTEPITAPAGTWTWVPFSNTQCGNGSPAGIGINPAPGGSRQVFVYLEGGGACWDSLTCYVLKTSVHVDDTYSQATLDSEIASLAQAGLTDREDADNPFRAAHFVFIPYCTGDLHAGDAVRSYDSSNPQRKMYHRGAANMDAFLARLKNTFPDAEEIWLTGSSAGGYGAELNFERFSVAFPAAHVDLLADSAQLVTPYGGRWDEMKNAWNPQFPEGCTTCAQDLPTLVDTLVSHWPNRRLGLLAYDNDGTLTSYLNYPSGEMLTATNALLASEYTHDTTHYFVLSGTNHTLLGGFNTIVGPGGVSLKTWIRQWAEGDPSWTNVR